MSDSASGHAGPPSSSGAAGAGLRCYRHPLRETGVRCVRCERPICPECMRPAPVGFQCPDDAGRATRSVRRTARPAPWLRPGRPWLTWALIAANVVVYVATVATSVGGINRPDQSRLFTDWQMVPFEVDHGEYYRLITSAFLHVNLLHLAMNMLAVGVVGPYLEPLLGRGRYLAVYVLSALGGSTAVYLLGGVYNPVAGASGAIFGLFAAALLLVREAGLDPQWLIGTLVLNFVLTFTVPDISWLGHLGGFLAGLASTAVITGVPGVRGVLRRRAGRASRLPAAVQAGGLSAVTVVLVVLVALRTASL